MYGITLTVAYSIPSILSTVASFSKKYTNALTAKDQQLILQIEQTLAGLEQPLN